MIFHRLPPVALGVVSTVVLSYSVNRLTDSGPSWWWWIVVAGAIGFATGSIWLYKAESHIDTGQTKIAEACFEALLHAARKSKLKPQNIGVSVYKTRKKIHVRKPCLSPAGRIWPFYRSRHLYAVFRFRGSPQPQPTDIRWTEYKGTPGASVRYGGVRHKNWSQIFRRVGQDSRFQRKKVLTRELYERELDEVERGGFSYEELRALWGKYAEVLAFPVSLLGSGKVIGTVVLDRVYYETDDPQERLGSKKIEAIAARLAGDVRDYIVAAPRLKQ